MSGFREISERDASGAIAAIYEEARQAYAAPYVSSLLRHLATYPGLLEWIWESLRPAFACGALQHAGWSRVDVSRLPALPRLTRDDAGRLGIGPADLAVIGDVCGTFVRVSPVNLVLAGCVRRMVTGDWSGFATGPGLTHRPLPPALPKLPAMVGLDALDAGQRATLAGFATDLAGSAFVPGLYRMLARWPGYLADVADRLGPLLRDSAVLAECERIADRIAAAAPAILGGLPAPSTPPPLADGEVVRVVSAISTYRGTSPQMAGFGTLLLNALPDLSGREPAIGPSLEERTS